MREVKAGFRYFKCEDCGAEWKTPVRDHKSPSQEPCIDDDCCYMNSPERSEPIDSPVDSYGNLLDEGMPIKL